MSVECVAYLVSEAIIKEQLQRIEDGQLHLKGWAENFLFDETVQNWVGLNPDIYSSHEHEIANAVDFILVNIISKPDSTPESIKSAKALFSFTGPLFVTRNDSTKINDYGSPELIHGSLLSPESCAYLCRIYQCIVFPLLQKAICCYLNQKPNNHYIKTFQEFKDDIERYHDFCRQADEKHMALYITAL